MKSGNLLQNTNEVLKWLSQYLFLVRHGDAQDVLQTELLAGEPRKPFRLDKMSKVAILMSLCECFYDLLAFLPVNYFAFRSTKSFTILLK